MNTYQAEQIEALTMIRRQIEAMGAESRENLLVQIKDYLLFREQVGEFLEAHFTGICTQKCYQSRLSACCAKDGIITFFADMVVNMLVSNPVERDLMEHAVQHPKFEYKCIYLSESGCVWKIKPVVCEFFLCDEAESQAIGQNPEALAQWKAFEDAKKIYTWPDQPVLFESLERFFMNRGCDSALMYLHKSPGLVRIRRVRDGMGDSGKHIQS
ncbi:MAG: hypothetical protein MUE70_00870 [Desulfobacterales bacterium]|nr:hypothetical protein [Desulfobacterales bacterium]